MLSLLLFGFLLGMRHTLEADHLSAVAALTSSACSTKSALTQGALWGVGHTLALFLFGSIVLIFESAVPEQLATRMEFVVGLMLCVLGCDVLYRLVVRRVHFHRHQQACVGSHFHAHAHSTNAAHQQSTHHHCDSKRFPARALVVGAVHGMAGSAALILLTLQSVDSVYTGMIYIGLFGIGSIVGMALLSVLMAIPLRYSARGLTRLHGWLQLCIGTITIYFGAALAIENLPV